MKEGRESFNPFAGKKGGKGDEGREEHRKKSKRKSGKRMTFGRK